MGIEQLRNANYVKSITLDFDFGHDINNYYMENMENDDGLLMSMKKMLLKCRDDLETQKLSMRMYVGRKQTDSMNVESVRNLLSSLNLDSEVISEITIEYKNGLTEKKTPAFLRGDNIQLKDRFALKESYISPVYLLNNCEELFIKNRYLYTDEVRKVQIAQKKSENSLGELVTIWNPEVE